MKISCSFCGEKVNGDEVDFISRMYHGKLVYCEDCQENFDKDINETRRI